MINFTIYFSRNPNFSAINIAISQHRMLAGIRLHSHYTNFLCNWNQISKLRTVLRGFKGIVLSYISYKLCTVSIKLPRFFIHSISIFRLQFVLQKDSSINLTDLSFLFICPWCACYLMKVLVSFLGLQFE